MVSLALPESEEKPALHLLLSFSGHSGPPWAPTRDSANTVYLVNPTGGVAGKLGTLPGCFIILLPFLLKRVYFRLAECVKRFEAQITCFPHLA